MQRNNSSVLVLLSGGIDSTALVQYYKNKNFKVQGVFFDYGQKSKEMEYQAAKDVSQHYQIKTDFIDLGFSLNQKNGEFFGRNALFVIAAAGLLPNSFSRIAIGAHRGVPYYDCTDLFIKDCQNILDGYFNGTVLLDAPFISFSKSHVYNYCFDNNVPLQITYSCENGSTFPCETCPSCKDRSFLNELSRL